MSPRSKGRPPARRSRAHRRSTSQRRTSISRGSPPIPQELIDAALEVGRRLLSERDPLNAEILASQLAGTWSHPDPLGKDTEASAYLEGELVRLLVARRSPEATAVLAALAAVLPRGRAEAARAAVRGKESTAALPGWAARIGAPVLRECTVVNDEAGDATQVVVTFGYAGWPVHALRVLVDHNLGDIAKDAWIADHSDALLAELRPTFGPDSMLREDVVDPAYARALLESAFAETDRTLDPPVSAEFANYHLLARARLPLLPAGGTLPDVPEWAQPERDALLADFLASAEASGLPGSADLVASHVIDHGCDYDHGQPLRVSGLKTELFLLDWLPHKVMLGADEREAVPQVTEAWIRYAARRTGLSARALEDTLSAAEEFGPEFADAYDDPESWGPARAMVEPLTGDAGPGTDLHDALTRRLFAVPTPQPDLDVDDDDELRLLVADEHPEYADALGSLAADVAADGVNPRLHITLHEVIARQLWYDDPPEVWATAQRLTGLGFDRHNVLHALMFAMGEQLRQSLLVGQPYDHAAYVDALDVLPGSWEAAAGGRLGRSGT